MFKTMFLTLTFLPLSSLTNKERAIIAKMLKSGIDIADTMLAKPTGIGFPLAKASAKGIPISA